MCILLQCFGTIFFYSKVFGLKMQKSFFKEKMVLRVVFLKIEVKLVTNLSTQLEKHQTIEILLMVDF